MSWGFVICVALGVVGCEDEADIADPASPMDAGVDGGKPPIDHPPDADLLPDAAPHDAGIFSDATEVELVQAFLEHSFGSTEDAGLPADVMPGEATLALRDGKGHLTYIASATCGEPFDAFMVREGDQVHVLFRSRGATACGGAFYRMRIVIDGADADTHATVYMQDALGGAIEVRSSATVAGADADCTGFVHCSSSQPCDREGPISEELVIDAPNDIHGCTTLDVCGVAACIDHREACLMTCNTPDCAILESYPVQVHCNP